MLQYTWEIQHNLHLIINSEWLLLLNIYFMFVIEEKKNVIVNYVVVYIEM